MEEIVKVDTAEAGLAQELVEGLGELVGSIALPCGVVDMYPLSCHLCLRPRARAAAVRGGASATGAAGWEGVR